jgi:hypothetical protein
VEATFAEGLAARLFGGTRLPELDNVGHWTALPADEKF